MTVPLLEVCLHYPRPVEDRFPACLAIDYDNAEMMDYKVTEPRELRHRTVRRAPITLVERNLTSTSRVHLCIYHGVCAKVRS